MGTLKWPSMTTTMVETRDDWNDIAEKKIVSNCFLGKATTGNHYPCNNSDTLGAVQLQPQFTDSVSYIHCASFTPSAGYQNLMRLLSSIKIKNEL